MEDKIKYVIELVIKKKYPVISEVVSVKDLYSELLSHSSVLGKNYVVKVITDKCLDDIDMIKIDEDIKTLFTMMGVDDNNPFSIGKTPGIKTFFDCGDGEGFVFKAPYGYNH